jgi:transcription-repair coupling factor (superfamily II helicase)
MANKNNSNQNGAKNENAQVDVKDLIARLNALTEQVKAVATGNVPAPTSTPKKRGRKATVKAEPKVESWDTVGKASETIENAQAFQHRVSVQVQKSSEGRTQVHIYSQVCVPADRIRANTKGLDKQSVKTSDGKAVDGFWLNQKNPLIIRGNQKESIAFLTTLIENAK